jgi:uncharacterized membrane protein
LNRNGVKGRLQRAALDSLPFGFGMQMSPAPVLALVVAVHTVEIAVVAALFLQVAPVSAILTLIPLVVIPGVTIIITAHTLSAMVVIIGLHRNRGQQNDA